jgi:hypothetical protein
MTIAVPTETPELMYPTIEAATNKLEDAAVQSPAEWDKLTIDRQMQNEFLTHFKTSFNITIALARSGAKQHQFMRWRNTELSFTKAYNGVHTAWKARLITSAMTRAVGYLTPCSPSNPTISGYREDAAGTPIFEGADTRLTIKMLESHFPEVYSPSLNVTTTALHAITAIPDDATGEEAADAYARLVGQS